MSQTETKPAIFRIQPDDEPVQWPVTLTVPTANGPQRMQFTAHFLLLDDEAAKAEAAKGDTHFIGRVLVGWGADVQDEHGQPLPFSAEAVGRLCERAYRRRGIVEAYYQCASGILVKN